MDRERDSCDRRAAGRSHGLASACIASCAAGRLRHTTDNGCTRQGGMTMEPFVLPESFLLGTATASLQIEGGDHNNSWYRWVQTGHVKDGTSCIVADDHWNRVTEDIALMKQLHQQTYRMSPVSYTHLRAHET